MTAESSLRESSLREADLRTLMVREGQVRSGRSTGWKGRYLREGTESMVKSWS